MSQTPTSWAFRFVNTNKLLIAIILFGAFLRFYDYPDRWGIAYDQAWFATIARHGLDTFQLPLLGPFASGGPFQTGGEWFWVVMIGIIPLPNVVNAPWIFLTFLSVMQIIVFYLLGVVYKNKQFGLLLAFLGAISSTLVLQATNLTNQMLISIIATVFLIFSILYIRNKKISALFFASLSIGLASSLHFQGVMLLPALFILFLVTKSFHWKKIGVIALGVIIPWLPVLFVDVQNNFFNTISLITYYKNPQSQASYEILGRRWLTFIFDYMPTSWGYIIGGNKLMGYLGIILAGIFAFITIIKRKITVELLFVFLTIGVLTIVLRYLKIPLYENYINFLHPFIFVAVGLGVTLTFKFNKILGIAIICSIAVFSLTRINENVSISVNTTANKSEELVRMLKQKYPGEKFAIYDFKNSQGHRSMPLSYYLLVEGLTDSSGKRIGIAAATDGGQLDFIPHTLIHGEYGAEQVFDLSSSTAAELTEYGWFDRSPEYIYNSVQYWYK